MRPYLKLKDVLHALEFLLISIMDGYVSKAFCNSLMKQQAAFQELCSSLPRVESSSKAPRKYP